MCFKNTQNIAYTQQLRNRAQTMYGNLQACPVDTFFLSHPMATCVCPIQCRGIPTKFVIRSTLYHVDV